MQCARERWSRGLYYLTGYNDYDGAVTTIALGTHGTVTVDSQNGMQLLLVLDSFSATFETSGSTLTIHETCPGVLTYAESYTASDTELIFYSVDTSNNVTEAIYSKQ